MDVLCVGEVLYDCIYDVEKMGDPQFDNYPGGAPANVASALSKFGVSCGFLGSVGNDIDGHQLLGLLQSLGVNTDYCQVLSDAAYPTRKVTVARYPDGDRRFAGFWGNLPSESFADVYYSPSSETMTRLGESIQSNVKAVVVGTLGLACESPTKSFMETIRAQVTSAQSKPLLVIDVNWRPVFWTSVDESAARERILDFIGGVADIVKLTDEEAAWLLADKGVTAKAALESPQIVFQHILPKVVIDFAMKLANNSSWHSHHIPFLIGCIGVCGGVRGISLHPNSEQ
jgi:fructokinase